MKLADQYGVIRKDGKLSYKTPVHDVHIEQSKINVIKRAIDNKMKRDAERAIEFWAMWRFGNSGYGASNCNVKDGDRLPAESRIIYGVEITPTVARVISVFSYMKDRSSLYASYADYIYLVSKHREKNETFKELFKRMDFGFTYDQYFNAKKVFIKLFNELDTRTDN